MITYLKNMEGWKHKDLKSKDFDSIKELFDKAFKRVNMFVDFRTDLVEGSSKRAGEELEQESTKKQKVDDDKETVNKIFKFHTPSVAETQKCDDTVHRTRYKIIHFTINNNETWVYTNPYKLKLDKTK
ncbi:hypothetical protein Tco_0968585 [Tanacetum coccineum]